jgi:hypothetical protein
LTDANYKSSNRTLQGRQLHQLPPLPACIVNGVVGEVNEVSPRRGINLAHYPHLARLRISAEDLQVLAIQGHVSREVRGSTEIYKLRFRTGSRQNVRYVGNADRAALIRSELTTLQADRRVDRDLVRLAKTARQMLRSAKQTLRPVAEANGLTFHGYALRSPRNARSMA